MAGHWRYRRARVVSWHARIVISCVRTAMWRPVWGMTNKLQNHTLSRPHIARRSENMQKLRDTLFPILLSFLRISVTQLVPCEGHRTHGHGRSAENTDDPQRIVKTLACRGETVEQLLLTLRGTFFFSNAAVFGPRLILRHQQGASFLWGPTVPFAICKKCAIIITRLEEITV